MILHCITAPNVLMKVAKRIRTNDSAPRETENDPMQLPAMHKTKTRHARLRGPEPKLRSATQPQPKVSLPRALLSQDKKKMNPTPQSMVRSAPLATTRSNESTADTNGSLRIDVPDRV